MRFFIQLSPSAISQKKRYSLQTGPPKKDPKVKGVNSTAVQAFLKKKQIDDRKKGTQPSEASPASSFGYTANDGDGGDDDDVHLGRL